MELQFYKQNLHQPIQQPILRKNVIKFKHVYIYIRTYVCMYLFIPPEPPSQHNLMHSHHNSNDVPKVYTPSTMIETCIILQYLSSENKTYIRICIYVNMIQEYSSMMLLEHNAYVPFSSLSLCFT